MSEDERKQVEHTYRAIGHAVKALAALLPGSASLLLSYAAASLTMAEMVRAGLPPNGIAEAMRRNSRRWRSVGVTAQVKEYSELRDEQSKGSDDDGA